MVLEDARVLAPIIVTIVTDYHGEGLLLKFDLRPRNRADNSGAVRLLVPIGGREKSGYLYTCLASRKGSQSRQRLCQLLRRLPYIYPAVALKRATLTGQALQGSTRGN